MPAAGKGMLFNSFVFLTFLAVVVPIYWLMKGTGRKVWLLSVSYLFYGYWDWRFLFLILLSTLIDYLVGIRMVNAG